MFSGSQRQFRRLVLDRSNAASPPIQEGHGGAEDVEHGAGAQGEGAYLVHGGAGGVEVVEDDKPADPADERGQRSEGGKCAQATCGAFRWGEGFVRGVDKNGERNEDTHDAG